MQEGHFTRICTEEQARMTINKPILSMGGDSVIHQPDRIFRPRLHHTFEWKSTPASTITGQTYSVLDASYPPNNAVVVPDFRDPWMPLIVNRREDIERGKDTCDGET